MENMHTDHKGLTGRKACFNPMLVALVTECCKTGSPSQKGFSCKESLQNQLALT